MYLPFERSVVVVGALVLLQRLFAIVLLGATFKGTLEKHDTAKLCLYEQSVYFFTIKMISSICCFYLRGLLLQQILKRIIPDSENIFHRIVQDMITTSAQVQERKIPVVLLEKYSGFGSKSLDVIEENTKNVNENH